MKSERRLAFEKDKRRGYAVRELDGKYCETRAKPRLKTNRIQYCGWGRVYYSTVLQRIGAERAFGPSRQEKQIELYTSSLGRQLIIDCCPWKI